MRFDRLGLAASLTVLSLAVPPELTAVPDDPALSGVQRFFGTTLDSVTVRGNKRTQTFAILREMESRPGTVLTEKAIRRDLHYLSDLSPIATVAVAADSLGPGRTALRVTVEERSGWFLRAVLPTLKYNFETGLTYGLRWKDKNFGGRLEQVSVDYQRNQRGDDAATVGWSSPWVGWRHIGIGAHVRYFHRGDTPREISLLEDVGVATYIALPLTQSRIRFSQVEANLALDKSRTGSISTVAVKDVVVSPAVGYRFDSRDSPLTPRGGGTFYAGVGQSITLDDGRDPFYRFNNEVRLFFGAGERSVIALLSDIFFQFGDYPDFSTVGLGGAETLRGYPERRFIGTHRWHGTIEWRYAYLPRKVFRLPVVKQFDIGLGFVTFLDSGIVWSGADDFRAENLHGTAGVGFAVYSPIRDVVRLDFGFSLQGDARFNAGTGIRF
jgi:outer membrane protein assembly factor BamA